VIFSGVRATKSALVGVSLLSAAEVAAFDFFCAEFGQGQKTIRFARLSLKAVIFTALKSLRRSTANARNHWHDSLRNTDENHTLRDPRLERAVAAADDMDGQQDSLITSSIPSDITGKVMSPKKAGEAYLRTPAIAWPNPA
jgi:hypothetical protein